MSGAMNQGPDLIKYGIAEDESDYRIHVGLGGGRVYVFATRAGQEALRSGRRYTPFAASQDGVDYVTGLGRRVPWRDVDGCVQIMMPRDLMMDIRCTKRDSPNVKGREAVRIVLAMFERGILELPPVEISNHHSESPPEQNDPAPDNGKAHKVHHRGLQLKGIDLITDSGLSAQVKCDWNCTRKGLALQTHEINPHKLTD